LYTTTCHQPPRSHAVLTNSGASPCSTSGGRACASLAVCTARLRACCSRCRPSRLLHNRLECRSAARMPLGRRSASVGGGRAASSRRWRAAEGGLLVQRRAGWGCVTARWGRGRRAHRQKIPVNARTCVNPGPSPTLSHLLAAAQHLLRGITTARPACWPRGASHLSGASSRTWCALPATPCPAMLGGAVEAAAHPGGMAADPARTPSCHRPHRERHPHPTGRISVLATDGASMPPL
jgi:hypothetical protein